MKMTLCPYCMKEAAGEICSHCGKPVAYGGEPAHLQAGFVLNGTHPYILGAALGQGGFGITYIALDMVTNQRVAIKEYYPTYCAVRSDARTVTFYRGQEEVYNKGRDRFLDEARVLKSLSDIKSIVNVRDFFEANNTAYLVMEFLEGDSLKAHAQKYGKFPAQEFLRKLRPLMEDIDQMHQRGVVHRDIAPDNIILMPDGQMKLIDFGAARSYVGDKSMTVVVKKGFAPIEQYMRHGSTAATDVYALAATIYYCITGVVPPDSAERQYEEDKLKSPTSLGAELSKEQERALLKALEIQPKQRTQTVAELAKALVYTPKPEKPKLEKLKPVRNQVETKQPQKKEESPKKTNWIVSAVAAALLCVLGAVLFMGKETPAVPGETEPPVVLSEEAQKYNEAIDLFHNGEYGKAAIAFAKLGDYRDAREISFKIWDAMTVGDTISINDFLGDEFFVGLKADGTVMAVGENGRGQCDVSDWTDIVAINAGSINTVGLKADGTVVAVGEYDAGQCNVSGWTDIVAISAGTVHTVGLKADGTVVAVGSNDNGKCDVSGWTDIVTISALNGHTVGLKADGTVVAVGDNYDGRCDVSGWRDIVAISARINRTVGLKADGTVLAVGDNIFNQCEVSGWQDIVAISAGDHHTIGLKADGTVVAVGSNVYGQCNVSRWTDIVAISAGDNHTVGLKADGTVVAVGATDYGKSDVSDWTDIVAISAGEYHTFGLKADGRVVAMGKNDHGQCDVSGWKDIRLPTIPEERLSEINLNYITEE